MLALVGGGFSRSTRARIPDSLPRVRASAARARYLRAMRAVFSSWLIVIAVGLAYMITIPLLGR